MYERLTTVVNIMDRNNVRLISVSINAKFLNCLQPEWRKYVTMSSKAKRAARNHDPLALIAHSNASSQSHASPLNSNLPQPYYVTHPSSVIDYEEDYQWELQGDSQEDKLTTAMINQAVIQDGRVDIQTKNAGYGGNGDKNAGRQNMNQAFNAGNENDESNQIVQRIPRTESNPGKANVQSDDNAVTKPNYDAKAVSEVNASHKVHEQVNHVKRKTIIHTPHDDQIDSYIIFDDPYVENNGGTSEHDSNAHDEYHAI
ncbi:hypothetical protein Tco_0792646 [Tanacetum coccineum]